MIGAKAIFGFLRPKPVDGRVGLVETRLIFAGTWFSLARESGASVRRERALHKCTRLWYTHGMLAYRLGRPLNDLTGTARGRVLEALHSGPEAGVSLRELARGAGLSLSSLQREISTLSSLGFLNKKAKGNRVLHRLKREEPFVKLLWATVTALGLRGVQLNGMPADRNEELALVRFCAHLPPDADLWRRFGDPRFLAGLAVTLAGHSGFDRPAYLALAESLAPGSGTVERHEAWFRAHRPDFARLLSMIDRERRTYARSEN